MRVADKWTVICLEACRLGVSRMLQEGKVSRELHGD